MCTAAVNRFIRWGSILEFKNRKSKTKPKLQQENTANIQSNGVCECNRTKCDDNKLLKTEGIELRCAKSLSNASGIHQN